MATIQTPTQTERRIPMSYAEFLAATEGHAEWVAGETIFFTPSGTAHQHIVGFLLALLHHFLQKFRMGEVIQAPYEMRLPGGNSREPDILVVMSEHLEQLTDKRLVGPADIAIEVISDESVTRDRTVKFNEYQRAGIREYWLIDPRPGFERADFWVLGSDGRYQPIPLDQGHIFHSTVLRDFWLDTNWLWANPIPNSMYIFALVANLPDVHRALQDAGIGQ